MSFLGKIDGNARYDRDGEVDHAASAKENLAAAGRDLKLMRLDKTGEAIEMYARAATIRDMEEMGYDMSGEPNPYLLALKSAVRFPLGVVQDAAEIAVAPLLAVKDLADAAVHGIIAGLRRWWR